MQHTHDHDAPDSGTGQGVWQLLKQGALAPLRYGKDNLRRTIGFAAPLSVLVVVDTFATDLGAGAWLVNIGVAVFCVIVAHRDTQHRTVADQVLLWGTSVRSRSASR